MSNDTHPAITAAAAAAGNLYVKAAEVYRIHQPSPVPLLVSGAGGAEIASVQADGRVVYAADYAERRARGEPSHVGGFAPVLTILDELYQLDRREAERLALLSRLRRKGRHP